MKFQPIYSARIQSGANSAASAFTLIELSILLVIIGLIVGGVLVGQDLIRAAAVRATVSQIEKFNQAVNTFYGKYGYLPGDIKDPEASSFGFASRGQYAGEGDGNGIIMGINCNSNGCTNPHSISAGEAAMMWQDLSVARLIEGSFTSASPSTLPSAAITLSSTPSISAYLPPAKLGLNNFLYVYSAITSGGDYIGRVNNFFGVSAITQIPQMGDPISSPGLTVQQAFNIDNKIDDGLPKSGNVLAVYLGTGGALLPAGGGAFGASLTNAASGSTTTCYDNNHVVGATQQYSIKVSNGSNINCALSFQFQ